MGSCDMEKIIGLAKKFSPEGLREPPKPFGNGHINDTYLLESAAGEKWILQRINRAVFPDPMCVMENMRRVTDYLKDAVLREGGDPAREVLRLIPTADGESCVWDPDGNCWRCCLFVPDSVSYDHAENMEILRESGRGFGRFFRLLDGFDVSQLHETIAHFHDTPHRFEDFHEAVRKDAAGRASGVKDAIEEACSWEPFAPTLTEAMARGEIPMHVTHNDTKLNNVLLSKTTGKAMCVIDLDTVMPGAAAYDFGDAIRTGASTADEDEKNTDLMGVSTERFTAYTEGFLEQAAPALTSREAATLVDGAKMMTMENAIRFLGDYLNGDIYFKVAYPEHNLVRARAQFKLAAALTAAQNELDDIVMTLYRKYHG